MMFIFYIDCGLKYGLNPVSLLHAKSQPYPLLLRVQAQAPFTQRENADISTLFGLSFTRKPCFYHRKQIFLKTLAKVEISDNAGYVLSCQLGETGF